MLTELTAVSPVDGRYRSKTEKLADYFSEQALIRYRIRVEVEYFIALCEIPLPQLAGVSAAQCEALRGLYRDFTAADAARVKEIEAVTNHDVKAVEYIKQLIDSGYCNSAPYTDTRYPLQDAFSAGTLAMMIGPMNMVSADSTVNYQSVNIPGKGVGLGVCDQLMVFKKDDVKDQDARTAAIRAFFDFFYNCERYSDYMVYEGFLPATTDSSDYLASNAEKHKVGGSDATGNSEYFKNFCGLLPNCQFYPMSKAEWMDVRNGVIEVEQQVCQGSISAQEALDNLQNSIAG